MRSGRRGEIRKAAQDFSFWLFRAIGTHSANRGFAIVARVRVHIPKPFDRARPGAATESELPREKRSLFVKSAVRGTIDLNFVAHSCFLNEHRLRRILRDQRIPQQRIVRPPSVRRGEIENGAEKRGRWTIFTASFVLTDRYELLASNGANRIAKFFRPGAECVLR